MNPLVEYIQTQLNNGYTRGQVKQYLIQQGYKEKEIDFAINEILNQSNQAQYNNQTQNNSRNQSQQQFTSQQVQQSFQPQQSQQELLETQLTSYVLQYLQQGYQPDQLSNYLRQQGYDQKTLKSVFNKINSQYYHGQMQSSMVHEHAISSSSIMKMGMMLVFVFLIVGGGFFLTQNLFDGDNGNKLLDVKATPMKTKLTEDDVLAFTVDLINQGDAGRVDVYLDYILRDEDSNMVKKEEDTRALETTLEFQKKLFLPELKTGLYSLEVVAKYEGKVAASTFTISYQADEEEPAPDIPDEPINVIDKPDDSIDEIDDVEVKKPKPTSETKGKTDQDIFDFAIEQESKDNALSYCVSIEDETLLTECYYTVSQQHDDSEVCKLIPETERREDCIMNFVMLGSGDLCEGITLPENKQLCDQLNHLYKIKDYTESGDDEALTDYLGVPEHDQPRTPTEEEINAANPNLDDFSINDMVD